ncbi:MAG: AAA family ATPase [Sulfurovum sp.]
MRLKKLYIHNYKSFYDTTIELGKFNIIVGENNSGKSNIIDVLEFIDIAMSKDIERAISDKGGYDNLKNYRTDEEKIIIRATFENSMIKSTFLGDKHINAIVQGEGEYTLSFSFTKKSILFSIYLDMDFRIIKGRGTDKELIERVFKFENNEHIKKLKANSVKFIISNRRTFNNSDKTSKLYIYKTINRKFIEENLSEILHFIDISKDENLNIKIHNSKYISTYYFNIEIIKDKSDKDSTSILKKDGSNLGKNLSTYLSKTTLFDIVSNSLITTVNEIDGINIHQIADNYIITFIEGDREISINKVSDGTVNLLATITALNQPINKGSLLVFEEPERHLHLKAVNYLLDSFRASENQIIITTHSTEILKDANLEEIIFIYRDSDGDTQSLKATDIPDLEGKMKRLGYDRPLSLDELIADNIIGDFR